MDHFRNGESTSSANAADHTSPVGQPALSMSDLALNYTSGQPTPILRGEQSNPFDSASERSNRDSNVSSQVLPPPPIRSRTPSLSSATASEIESVASPALPAQVLPASPATSQKAIRFSVGPTPPRSPRTEPSSPMLLTPPSSTSGQMSPAIRQADPFDTRQLRHRSNSSFFAPSLKRASSSLRSGVTTTIRKPYPSTKLEGDIEKPWLKYPDPAARWGKIIFWSLIGLAFAGAGAIVAFGWLSIPQTGKLCLVMDDDFSNGIDPAHWTHEVRLDGFGNHQFEWTTADKANSFVEDKTLYIVPTLTSDSIGVDAVTNGYTLNLTADGRCTLPSENVTACVAVSNSTRGTMINPVQGARLITKGKASIRYGKVEVTARMPVGDWIWPAIWMMPEESKYGDWPRSGEIDIAESRGNNYTYSEGGNDGYTSAVHWGPNSKFDSYWRTFGTRKNKLKGYTKDFNKFTLEWTEKYIAMYVNNRVYSTLDLTFDKSFWSRGNYPTYYVNGTETLPITNPWFSSSNNAAPFDQNFYLILNVAVGGTNGFFQDNVGGKPWLDSSLNAMGDFWAAKDRWLPSWPQDPKQRGMAVKSVKMWRQC